MSMKIRDYSEKKYETWRAETERNLPLLMKNTLLVLVTSVNKSQEKLVCISLFT